MRHTTIAPHVLLIEPTPVYALLSSVELDAAGFEVTLARSLEDGLRWAEALLDSQQPSRPTLILLNLTSGGTAGEPFPALRLVQQLRQRMDQGLLREATIVGLLERPTRAAEVAARMAGCHLLRVPLGASAAHFLRRIMTSTELSYWQHHDQSILLAANHA